MKVDFATLRAAIEKSLAHAEETYGPSMDIADDLYWFVPGDQLYDPTKEPVGLTLGSLADDWSELEAVARGEKETIGYLLVWASAVLRALGDRTP
jgi:hypothetical protein